MNVAFVTLKWSKPAQMPNNQAITGQVCRVFLIDYRLQKTLKCGKKISDTLACGSCATFLVLTTF